LPVRNELALQHHTMRPNLFLLHTGLRAWLRCAVAAMVLPGLVLALESVATSLGSSSGGPLAGRYLLWWVELLPLAVSLAAVDLLAELDVNGESVGAMSLGIASSSLTWVVCAGPLVAGIVALPLQLEAIPAQRLAAIPGVMANGGPGLDSVLDTLANCQVPEAREAIRRARANPPMSPPPPLRATPWRGLPSDRAGELERVRRVFEAWLSLPLILAVVPLQRRLWGGTREPRRERASALILTALGAVLLYALWALLFLFV